VTTKRVPVKVEKKDKEDDDESDSDVEFVHLSPNAARRILWQRGHVSLLPSTKADIIRRATVKTLADAYDPLCQVGFAFIKATEGMTRVDDHFRSNWRHANDAHIHRGAYHFFLADRSASKQAAHFISTVTLKSGDLPPVLDVEGNMGAGTETIRNGVKEWLSLIEQHFGIKPIIYTNIDFYEKYLAGQFDDYPLWVAHYIKQRKPRISRNWLFWQHSEKGRVNGIDYPVDFNVFNGDSSDFQNLLIR
jgi:lysozyme